MSRPKDSDSVFVHALISDKTTYYGDRGLATLEGVGMREWTVSQGCSSVSVAFDLYLSMYFVNARRGVHPVRIVIANDRAQVIHNLLTSPIEVPGRHYAYATTMQIRDLELPVGTLFLWIVIDEVTRNGVLLSVFGVAEGRPAFDEGQSDAAPSRDLG